LTRCYRDWSSDVCSSDLTLKMASDLCGQAALRERGQDHHTRHEAMTPDMIRQLPAGHALIVRGGYAPVIARLGAAWKDPAYKTADRKSVVEGKSVDPG